MGATSLEKVTGVAGGSAAIAATGTARIAPSINPHACMP
jgi:hypothetical protein